MIPSRDASPRVEEPRTDAMAKNPFLVALGERVRTAARPARPDAQGAWRRPPRSPSATSPTSNTASAMPRSWCCSRWRPRCTARWPSWSATSPRVSPEWLMIRELLRRPRRGRPAARPHRARRLLGGSGAAIRARSRRIALVGLRGAGKSTLGPMLADDARRALRRAEPRDREDRRLQHARDPRPLRHHRLPPLRAPRARRDRARSTPRW